ncbi:MAG TPA: hypothetical protein VNT81_18620 [Vicinamibacterales bacterium]|nr:hypothetical protein [Vicinamibacterales bacterium]
MKSVADALRLDTVDRVLRLPVLARIELALKLGDDDVALYAKSSRQSLAVARRKLEAQRRRGRTHSQSAGDDRA